MTTAPADVREVLLATIRGRLLDEDVHTLRGGNALKNHADSIAEHALDAALARGAGLRDVYVIAAAEARRLDADFGGLGLTDGPFAPALDSYPTDVPVEQLFPEAPPAIRGETLASLRRGLAFGAVRTLASVLSMRAFDRVFDAGERRLRERSLDPTTTTMRDLLDERERVALFTAGLYGDPEEPHPA